MKPKESPLRPVGEYRSVVHFYTFSAHLASVLAARVLPRHAWPLGGISWAPQSEYLKKYSEAVVQETIQDETLGEKTAAVAYMVFKNELGLCGDSDSPHSDNAGIKQQDGDWAPSCIVATQTYRAERDRIHADRTGPSRR
jgi:hypothetical protein